MKTALLSFCALASLVSTAFSATVTTGTASVYDSPSTTTAGKPRVDLFNDGKTRLVFRVDDAGMNHATNVAVERAIAGGCVTAVSVMVVTPWLDEAVEMLKRHPQVSVGLHSTLNSEWMPYRWGPVLPPSEVPSIVDEWGKFHPTRKDLVANNPNPDEVERELRAQVDLALRKGLKLSYIDHHMSAAVTTPDLKERFVRVADDYGLAISRWFGEQAGPVIYPVEPPKKPDFLVEGIRSISQPGLYLVVSHVGVNTSELSVLRDLNPGGLPDMAVHRQAELDALCDPRLKAVIREKGFEQTGYDALRARFLDRMTSPD